MNKILAFTIILPFLSVSHISGKSLEEVFTSIYQNHSWHGYPETSSGSGSTLVQTTQIRKALSTLFHTLNIETVLDAPCGDFNWMKKVDLSGIYYIGVDIVVSLIKENQKKYGQDTIQFRFNNITQDLLPKVDLIICRDCFLHLKYEDIFNILKNFNKTGSTYLLASTYADAQHNTDKKQVNSGYRPVNLQIAPFNFPEPLLLIDEGGARGKYLGIWRLKDIPKYTS